MSYTLKSKRVTEEHQKIALDIVDILPENVEDAFLILSYLISFFEGEGFKKVGFMEEPKPEL